MEKRKKKINIFHALDKPLVLRIFSIALAIIIWIILSILLFPTITMTVYDVPVKLDIEGTNVEELGLSPVNYNEVKVDVRLSGMRYEIGNYNADDLIATLDLDEVKEDGSYVLDVNVKSVHDDKCDVIKVTPAKVKVKFDIIKSIDFPLEVEEPGFSGDEGYTLKKPTVSPEKVKIYGPQEEINKIHSAVVKVNGSKQKLTETYITSDTELVLYTKDGAEIDQTNLTASDEAFEVTFPIYQQKTVPFTLSIQQAPVNFDLSILKYSFDPETITILSSGDLKQIESKNAGFVYLNQINLKDKKFEIMLDNGQYNDSGINEVTVKFDNTGFSSKTFTLDKSHIRVKNNNLNKNVEIKTEKISNVVIYGPTDVIKKLKADDLIAEYNMEGTQQESGSYETSVTIYSPKINTVWCYGTNEIIVKISDK